MRDPLAAALISRGTYHGRVTVDSPAVLITPDERDLLLKRLEQDRESMICVNCGSTQRLTFYALTQAKSCCEARKMVQASQILSELDAARKQVAAFRAKAKKARRRVAK